MTRTVAFILVPIVIAAIRPAQSLAWESAQSAQSVAEKASEPSRDDNASPSPTLLRDSARSLGTPRIQGVFQSYLNQGSMSEDDHLTAHTLRFYELKRYQLSAPERLLRGTATGAGYGMFAAAMGGTIGFMDEDSQWALVGAGALLGALLSEIQADSPRWSINAKWEPVGK